MPDAPTDRGDAILETQLVVPTVAAEPAPARLSVGGVLSRTMLAWWAHVLPFSAMSLGVFAPMLIVGALYFASVIRWADGATPTAAETSELALRGGLLVLAVVVSVVLSVVQMGAVTYATVRYLNGERAPLGRMVAVGFRRGLPVVGTWIVLSIVTVAGMVLLVVPGVLFLVAACVAVPAAVVERPGIAGAIRRSFALTRGSRWAILAAGLVVMVVTWILSAAVQAAAMVALTVASPAHAIAATLLVTQLGSALFSVLPIVAMAVCYHDLRRAQEGVDTAELARVFE